MATRPEGLPQVRPTRPSSIEVAEDVQPDDEPTAPEPTEPPQSGSPTPQQVSDDEFFARFSGAVEAEDDVDVPDETFGLLQGVLETVHDRVSGTTPDRPLGVLQPHQPDQPDATVEEAADETVPGLTLGQDGRLGVPDDQAAQTAEGVDLEGVDVAFPVDGGSFSDTFGAPRSGGRRHQGQDIFAERGTPVRAAVPGEVVKVGVGQGLGGNTVTVKGADGNFYYYAHLDAHADGIEVGQAVSAGAFLGTVGTTGNAAGTPPHLHFSVNEGRGNVRNPASFLQQLESDHEGHDHGPSDPAARGNLRAKLHGRE